MADRTSIEWTRSDDGTAGSTWNPIRGTIGRWACTRQSPGCDSCYAARLNVRFGGPDYAQPGDELNDALRLDDDGKALVQPFRWKAGRRVFVCSMTDLFHEAVPENWLDRIFAVMALNPRHTFMVLTKRPKRMRSYISDPETPKRIGRFMSLGTIFSVPGKLEVDGGVMAEWNRDGVPWPLPNVWAGTSIELDRYAWRANLLRETPAAVRFISAEPLLGPLSSLDLTDLHWVIAGSESGPGARLMDDDWVRDLRDRCQAADVAFFFKQRTVGGKKVGLPELDGRVWDQFPTSGRVAVPA